MNTNTMTKQCKYNVENGICNGRSCKTCHYNCPKQKTSVNETIDYGAIKRYNKGSNGITYRTTVMRF